MKPGSRSPSQQHQNCFSTEEKLLLQALKEFVMNLVHKIADERMQLMISRRTPTPVRKQMAMMTMRIKVLLP